MAIIGVESAATGVSVTPSDDTTYQRVRGVYVGTSGNLAVTFPGEASAVTFESVPAGALLPIQAAKIMATDTTASNIVLLF